MSPQPFHPQALRAAADEDELGKLWYARSYSRPTVKPGETLMIGDQTLQSLAPVMVAVTVCVLLVGQTSKPERKVGSNVITSLRDPQVRIELPKSAQYVGPIAGFSMTSPTANCMRSSKRTHRKMFSGSTGCSLNPTCQAGPSYDTSTTRRDTCRWTAWTST